MFICVLLSGLLCCTKLHSLLLLYLYLLQYLCTMCYFFSSLCLSISFTFLICLHVFSILLWWVSDRCVAVFPNVVNVWNRLLLSVFWTETECFSYRRCFSCYTDLLFQYCNVSHRLCFFITIDSRTVCSCWGESRLQACSRIWSFSIQPRSSTSSI